MNKYELKMILLSELTIEQVEYLFTELINDKIGVFISGRGEELESGLFIGTIEYEKRFCYVKLR